MRLVTKVSDPVDRTFSRIISDISFGLRETTLTISDSTGTCSPFETEIVRVVSPSTTEITEIITIKKPIFRVFIP